MFDKNDTEAMREPAKHFRKYLYDSSEINDWLEWSHPSHKATALLSADNGPEIVVHICVDRVWYASEIAISFFLILDKFEINNIRLCFQL